MNLGQVRSLLFVPGARPDRFDTAANGDADAAIIDLEDAVAPEGKERARAAALEYLHRQSVLVRINAVDTPWHAADVAALADARPAGVVLPKTDSADMVHAVVSTLPADLPVLPLIESARGVREATAIAQAPGVVRLLFGNLDFALDTGITVRSAEQNELHYARSALVVASRATGLPGPVDGVHPNVSDTEGLRAATSRARDMGFTGLLCIHPSQVEIVHRGFRPTERELAWARRVVEVAGEENAEAVMVDGQMIDTPRWELARRLLLTAE